jgi:lipopolysaccharide biosynthesis glycosyltransferase
MTGAVEFACCFDRAYILPTAVMAASVLAHASPHRRYILHLVYDGADDRPLHAFRKFRGTRLEVRLVKARNDFVGVATAYPGMPPVSFLRLALADLLPDTQKVLSLDPDVVCLTDIAALFDTALDGAPLAAVPDLGMANGLACELKDGRASADGSTTRYFESRLGLNEAERAAYFNAGVLLFDLECLRRENFARGAQAFLSRPGEPVRWSEQCVLNAFFARRYMQLGPRWNAMVDPPGLHSYRAGGFPLMQRVAEAWSEPAILHFNWRTKPWLSDPIRSSWMKTWWAYALATPVPWSAWRGPTVSKRKLWRYATDHSVRAKAAELRSSTTLREAWRRR